MKFMRSVIILIWQVFWGAIGYTQTPIDSLSIQLEKATDSLAIDILNELSKAYLRIAPDSAMHHARAAIDLSEDFDYKKGKAWGIFNLGDVLQLQNDEDKAFNHYRLAQELFIELGNLKGTAQTYNRMAMIYGDRLERDTALHYLKLSKEIYESTGDQEGLIETYYNLGMTMGFQSKFDEALNYFLKCLTLADARNLDMPDPMIYYRIGLTYYRLNQENKAMEAYIKGLEVAEKTGDKFAQANLLSGIGTIYANAQNNIQEGLTYYNKSLVLFQELGIASKISQAYHFIGLIHLELNEYDKAETVFLASLNIRKELGFDATIGQSLTDLGYLHKQEGAYEESEKYFLEALKVYQKTKIPDRIALCHRELGVVYTHLNFFGKAEHHLKRSTEIQNEKFDGIRDFRTYQALSSMYEKKGDFRQALRYQRDVTAIRDSLEKIRGRDKLAELQTKYETEIKEQQIAAQDKELTILQQQKEIDSFWRKILIAGVILIATGAFLIFWILRLRNHRKQELLENQKAQTKQLAELNQMKSHFFANISHEFRTPLTLILGPLESLMEETQNAKSLQRLRLIHKNASQLRKLINQFLDLSKLEAGKLGLRASQGNLVNLAKGIFFSFQSLADKKKILLEFSCTEDEVLVFFEPGKLEQVFTNLISNALKFTPSYGKVILSLKRISSNNTSAIKVEVKDNGPGIPRDQLPYVFDRFFQGDHSDILDYEGTGVGLALSKELIELHGGEITVESNKGRGTVFSFILPLGREHLQENQIRLNIQDPDVTDLKGFGTTEISVLSEDRTVVQETAEDLPQMLIVEDNPDLRNYMKEIFAKNYQIELAINGSEGVAIATERIPDLIISDVMMPKMNGFELCKRLKGDIRTSHIPIILLTAKNEEEDRIEGFKNEVDDYLTKPFSKKELHARVANLIASRRKLRKRFSGAILLKPEDISTNSMDEIFLKKLKFTVEKEMGKENFGVEQLSKELAMSRVHLHRKLLALLNQTPTSLIQQFRLERAMNLLRNNVGTVSEIAYEVGFSSPTYFSKCFKKKYGYSPKEARGSGIVQSN